MKLKENLILIISAIIICCSLIIDIMPNMLMDIETKLIFYLFAMFLVFVDMKVKNKKLVNEIDKEKNRRKYLMVILIIYSILIASLLFLDGGYRRYGWGATIKLFSKEHFEMYSNFIPFKTIYGFIQKAITGSINNNIVFNNIIGNIIVFAPFGILVPMLFEKKFSKLKNFTLLMIGVVLAVEYIQFVTKTGSFDVDDLILNVLGAVIVFGGMKIKGIRNLVDTIIK